MSLQRALAVADARSCGLAGRPLAGSDGRPIGWKAQKRSATLSGISSICVE
jgi:hypothetical protein